MSGNKHSKKPELDVLEQMNRDEQRKKIFFIVGAVVVVLVLIAAGAVFALKSKDSDVELAAADRQSVSVDSSQGSGGDSDGKDNKKDKDTKTDKEKESEDTEQVEEQPSIEEVAKAGPPVEIPETFMTYAKEGDPGRFQRQINDVFAGTSLAASLATYPDQRSDTMPGIREALAAAGESIVRLLNPYFGGWVTYQHPESNARNNLDMSIFSDMFTPEYLASHAGTGDFSFLPIYADWDSDNYGMDNLIGTGVRWVGVPTDLQTEVLEESLGESVMAVVDVEFVSWTKDGKKVKKEGVMQLLFVPNRDPNGPAMLIDDAKLTV